MISIHYAACPYGYAVAVYDGTEQVHRYDAGNCRLESTTYVDPGSPHAISEAQLWRFAKQTAEEMDMEYEDSEVMRDDDLAHALNDVLGPAVSIA